MLRVITVTLRVTVILRFKRTNWTSEVIHFPDVVETGTRQRQRTDVFIHREVAIKSYSEQFDTFCHRNDGASNIDRSDISVVVSTLMCAVAVFTALPAVN